MKQYIRILATLFIVSFVGITACKKDKGVNIFTLEDDKELGKQLKAEIESNPQEYPVLEESGNNEAYDHLYRIRDELLNTGKVDYVEKFNWEVYIIDDDSVINAFAAPGGYMYFYTGLIKYLENEAQFAGVVAHEMAHVSQRHSTERLTKVYGVQVLLSVALGNDPGTLAKIAAQMAAGATALAFSRNDEYEADEYAIKYMSETEYHPKALASFFEKLEQYPRPPEFLSTHPSPENRQEKIDEVWKGLGSPGGEYFVDRYMEFIESLP